FRRGAGHDPVELLADPARQETGGRGLAHQPLDLLSAVLLEGAFRGERADLVASVRGLLSSGCGAGGPPGGELGIAPVGCRRRTGNRCHSRKRATLPLAAIMKSSIRFLARFGFSAASAPTVSPSNSARTSTVSSSSAPWSWRRVFSCCATPSWTFRFSASPGTAA